MNGTNENPNHQKPARNAEAHIGTGKENQIKRIKSIWRGMKNRCSNKKNQFYKNYGGRGISVCSEWVGSSINFIKWAVENGYSNTLTIDRIDPNGNYEPSNCRWVTNEKNVSYRYKIRNIYDAAMVSMLEKQNIWVTPEKENIDESIYIKLLNLGMCIRREDPYNSGSYQYHTEDKETINLKLNKENMKKHELSQKDLEAEIDLFEEDTEPYADCEIDLFDEDDE